MVKGQTYSEQLFESKAFRHFINIFLNKESGVTQGCEITQSLDTIEIGPGYFCIMGGFLEETTGTTHTIPTEAGYYKLVYEIDLSKVNTEADFNQGSYKFVKALGDYPILTQEDLDNDGTIYQFEFCKFRVTEEGLKDFTDSRVFINYGIYLRKDEISAMRAYLSNAQIAGQNQTCKLDAYEYYGDNKNESTDQWVFINASASNGIRVQKGVTMIRIYAQIFFEYIAEDQNYFIPEIRKNGVSIARKLTSYSKGSFEQADVYVSSIEVEEGDVITLNFGDVANQQPTVRAGKIETFMLVEKIK